jgi:uncharacterized protein (UPF0276 family)
MTRSPALEGRGLGIPRAFLRAPEPGYPAKVEFFELAPDYWVDVGGHMARRLRTWTARYPLVCRGRSLTIGGLAPLAERS